MPRFRRINSSNSCNRRNHVRAVLLSNDVRLGVDAKRPGGLRGAAGSNVARQNVSRLHRRVPEADDSAELVVLQERDADLADLVGLDDADAIPHSRGVSDLRTLIGERAGVAAGERDARPVPGRRRQPVIEIERQHVANQVRHRDVAGVRVVLKPGVGEHRVQPGGVVRPPGPRERVRVVRVALGVVELHAVGGRRHVVQEEVGREPQHLIVRISLHGRPREELAARVESNCVPVEALGMNRRRWQSGEKKSDERGAQDPEPAPAAPAFTSSSVGFYNMPRDSRACRHRRAQDPSSCARDVPDRSALRRGLGFRARPGGIEPPTWGSRVHCSAN